jgi:hypothetical protein
MIVGVFLIKKLTSKGVKHIIAPVHSISEHVQLKEHGLVCDVPPYGLIDDDLCPDYSPLQTFLHCVCWQLGALLDDEIYGSRCQVTQHCRQESFHLGSVLRKTTQHRCARQETPSLMFLKFSVFYVFLSKLRKEEGHLRTTTVKG